MTGKVDVKAGTLDFEDADLGAKGTGKLEGKPWHWTAYDMKLTKGDVVVARCRRSRMQRSIRKRT